MSGERPVVFIVDDDAAVRRSLRLLLDTVGLHSECYPSAVRFLEAYDENRCGCLLLDVRMPSMSGLDLQARLTERGSTLPIIFLTANADVPLAVRAMQAGAFDFLEKPFNDQELIDRVHLALERDARSRRESRGRDEVRGTLGRLTPREREVLELIVEGQANKIVAARLGISERTVEIHRARVMGKMEAASLAHLVRLWMLARAE